MATTVRWWSSASPHNYHLFTHKLQVYNAALLTRSQSAPWIPKLILIPAGLHFGFPSPLPHAPPLPATPLLSVSVTSVSFNPQTGRPFPPLMAITLSIENVHL